MNAVEKEIYERPEIMAEPDLTVRRAMVRLHQFTARRDAAAERIAAIREERKQYVYDASASSGQTPQRRHLDKLWAETGRLEHELAELAEAIAEAEKRVAAARARAAQSAAIGDARRAVEIAAELRVAGEECDDLLNRFATRYRDGIAARIEELHRLGFAPNPRLAHLGAERALAVALGPTRLSVTAGVIPPHQRSRTMGVVAAEYAKSATDQATRIIDGTEAA